MWLTEERTFGHRVGPLGAHAALIRYNKAGIEYEVYMENDEFEEITLEDLIEYDDDE